MNEKAFFSALISAFKHEPTPSQDIALQKITEYLFSANASDKLFLLKGFAGTGKTSITNCLIRTLPLINHQSVLLAPTGRAAKVMTYFTQRQAFTIHKYIYYSKADGPDVSFKLRVNKLQNTLFIVDEASMIADNDYQLFERPSLLNDLMRFVYSGKNCKLLLIGDTAQLPPVNTLESPALNIPYLEYQFQKEVLTVTLTEVVRQRRKSGILRNATRLRKHIFSSLAEKQFAFKINHHPDIIRLTDGAEIQDAISEAYDDYGSEETTVIVRSNKRAVAWNNQIRRVILDVEDEIAAGDLLMVVKNNYFWCKDNSQVSFIANGDTIEVLQLYDFTEAYGFRFAEVSAQLIDYPEVPPFDTVILLDTLNSEAPALSPAQSNQLYEEVLADYADEPTAYKRYQKVKENPYFNALQVKFSYAITCHKSQGGQWDAVFVEKPYLPDDIIDEGYLRWLYTAITRAKERVYLVGFKDEDFG